MKKIIAISTLAALFAAPAALAGEQMGFADVDANSDGYLSLEEVQAVKADATAEGFAEVDTDGDAQISEAEYDAWKAAKDKMDGEKDMMDDTSDS